MQDIFHFYYKEDTLLCKLVYYNFHTRIFLISVRSPTHIANRFFYMNSKVLTKILYHNPLLTTSNAIAKKAKQPNLL